MPNLKGVIFAIEGDAKRGAPAQAIAKSLGGIPVVIDSRDKPAYHAAAVLAAGSDLPTDRSRRCSCSCASASRAAAPRKRSYL